MRLGLFTVLVLFVLISSDASFARGKPNLFIDCQLRFTATTNCEDFKKAFFSKYKKFVNRELNREAAELVLHLTDESIDNTRIQYHFEWTSTLKEAMGSFTYPLILVDALDESKTLSDIRKNAAKGLVVFLDITSDDSDGEKNEDEIMLTFSGPTQDTPVRASWQESLASSPWYFDVAAAGGQTGNGSGAEANQVSTGSIGPEIGFFRDQYKVDVSGYTSYTHEVVSGQSGTVTANSTRSTLKEIFVYTLTRDAANTVKHKKSGVWSIAVVNTSKMDDGSNIKLQNNTQVGVEWTLVPFRTTENHELAIRLGPQFTTLSLYEPNDLNHLAERYVGAFAKVYYYWIFKDKLTATAGAEGDANFKYLDRSSVTFGLSASYQITENLDLSGEITWVYYDHESLYFPGNASGVSGNPLQGIFQTGQSGGQLSYSVSFLYNLGNSIKKKRDHRWLMN